LTVPGLVVDIRRQTYTVPAKNGHDPESGDVIAWLQRRYHWSFKLAVTYLKKRKPDELRPEMDGPDPDAEEGQPRRRKDPGCNKEPDSEPQDAWQRKALALAGDEIREYFSPNMFSMDILFDRCRRPARFVELIALDVDECEKCGSPFDWNNPETRAFQIFAWGNEDTEAERLAGFLEQLDWEGVVCPTCVRKQANLLRALEYCYFSASAREGDALRDEKQESERIERLIRKAAKKVRYDECLDIEYLLNRRVWFGGLASIEVTDEELARAFSDKRLFERLRDGDTEGWDKPGFWRGLVWEYSK